MAQKAQKPRGRNRARLDLASIAVAPAGIILVLVAQKIDGVPLGALLQWQAALIVIGGTLASVMISYTPHELWVAMRAAGRTFLKTSDDTDALAASMVALSIRAHRRGLLALESEIEGVSDPFLREGLVLAIDGGTIEALHELLAIESGAREAEEEAPARVFEAAAGYAPTLGILGAVLGLVQVMQRLGTPGSLGSGIAVAFVATVYGVGIANMFLLPVAGRLRERANQAARRRELMTHGLCAIHARMNPRLVARRLRSFSTDMPKIEEIASRLGTVSPMQRRSA
jgi:chemotaxis protein MotA